MRCQANRRKNTLGGSFFLADPLDETDSVEQAVLRKNAANSAEVHLAFLFASPLVKKFDDPAQEEALQRHPDQLNFKRELAEIKESLLQTNRRVRYKAMVATKDNLTNCLTENPLALHFSGHGVQKSPRFAKGLENYLIFEDGLGKTEYYSEKELRDLLTKTGTELECVFVSSCYSEFAGQIFLNAGARHVVCIREGQPVADEAAILFAKVFYRTLFTNSYDVCNAYEMARSYVEGKNVRPGEGYKFKLLIRSEEEGEEHECEGLGQIESGAALNVGHEP